ncbi:hypothetical protein D3C72_2209460 [compost metagenome]
MDRQALIEDAYAAGRAAAHNMRWMAQHPDRIDPDKAGQMQEYLIKMEAFAKEEVQGQDVQEMKNARLAGLTRLRSCASRILSSIIANIIHSVKH